MFLSRYSNSFSIQVPDQLSFSSLDLVVGRLFVAFISIMIYFVEGGCQCTLPVDFVYIRQIGG